MAALTVPAAAEEVLPSVTLTRAGLVEPLDTRPERELLVADDALLQAREWADDWITHVEADIRRAENPPTKLQIRLARARDHAVGSLTVRTLLPLSSGLEEDGAPATARTVEVEFFRDDGSWAPGGLAALADELGGPIAPRLAAMLYIVHLRYDRPVTVVGLSDDRAVEIYVDGISSTTLFEWARSTFDNAGIGHRLWARQVHIDIREISAHWLDRAKASARAEEQLLQLGATHVADPSLNVEASVGLPPSALFPSERPPRGEKLDKESRKVLRERKKRRR